MQEIDGKVRVLIEMTPDVGMAMAFAAGNESAAAIAAPELPGMQLDRAFKPVQVPAGADLGETETALTLHARERTVEFKRVVMRGEVDANRVDEFMAAATANRGIQGVFADVPVEPMPLCGNSPAKGNAGDVARLLGVPRLQRAGMTGEGVLVAIVDTGINTLHLQRQGVTARIDRVRSWGLRPEMLLGNMPVDHGTMCAFDACIAAPRCTLLDIALLQTSSGFETLLSDAIRAFAHLRTVLQQMKASGSHRALVVNNSWGMFHPSWDFPPGHPMNFSDNPNHTFNKIVATLEREGADILFAAGNCGDVCPDIRCQGVTNAIYGANSHPAVLTVAGVDTSREAVGYSTRGPGRIERRKPDLVGYTHFRGSEAFGNAPDSGTSAACPVVAGLVAAVRTRVPLTARPPAAIRELLIATTDDLGNQGFDYIHGYGVVNGSRIVEQLGGGAPLGSPQGAEEQAAPRNSAGQLAEITSELGGEMRALVNLAYELGVAHGRLQDITNRSIITPPPLDVVPSSNRAGQPPATDGSSAPAQAITASHSSPN